MENSTAFDLNKAVNLWHESLAQSPGITRDNLDELESHLRDSMTSLQCETISQEEAFLLATRRMGRPAALESEFLKNNMQRVWLVRIAWMCMGFLLFKALFSIGGSAGNLTQAVLYRRMTPNISGMAVIHLITEGVALICDGLVLALLWSFFAKNREKWTKIVAVAQKHAVATVLFLLLTPTFLGLISWPFFNTPQQLAGWSYYMVFALPGVGNIMAVAMLCFVRRQLQRN